MKKDVKKIGVLITLATTLIVSVSLGAYASSISNTPKSPQSIEPAKISKSKLVAPTLYSKTLALDWNYSAYLPAGYDDEQNKQKTYPVIYLLHGAFGNHRNIVERFPVQSIIDDLIETQKLPPSIVVFPDGFNTYYINGPALAMEDAFVKDFFPIIESTYRITKKKSARAIGGISMGGYGASRFALKHSKMFATALLISPAIWQNPLPGNTIVDSWHIFGDAQKGFEQKNWENAHPFSLLNTYKQANSPVEFLVISGEKDEIVNISEVNAFQKKLSQFAPTTFVSEPDGVHAWTYWEGATRKALTFAGKILKN